MQSKRKLFVHIGPLKTGTTSIQHMLHVLAPSLEQCGVHVVVASADPGKYHNHYSLIGGVTEPPTLDNPCSNRIYHWRHVLDELDRCSAERFVMSSERFSEPDARRGVIRRLRWLEAQANVEVEIVSFVRPQWQWAESYWCQSVASGVEHRRFEEWQPGWLTDMRADFNELDYNQLLEPWCENFGKVMVRPMEASQMPGGLLVHFLRLIGVHDERLFRATTRLRRQNLRLGAKDLEICRLVGLALAKQGIEQRHRANAVYGLDFASVLQEDWPFAGWTSEQALALNDLTAESNARFARDYGINDDGVLFRDGLPQDFDKRGRPASWEDISDVEIRAVRRYVMRKLNVDVEIGNGSGSGRSVAVREGHGLGKGSPDRETNSEALARRLASSMWKRGKSLVGHAWRLARAIPQIRLSRKGFLFARWVRWEAHEFWRRQFASLRWRFRRIFGG